MNEQELKIQAWVDNRFGVPNTFNVQLLEDFLRDFSPLISAEARKQIDRELFDIVHSRSKQQAYDKAVKYWQTLQESEQGER